MSDINYETEVLKFYPDAYCQCGYLFGVPFSYYIEDVLTGEKISKHEPDPKDAWQSAYNHIQNIKNDGKHN